MAFILIFASVLPARAWIFNNPYPANESSENIYYGSFSEQPKTLDPAKAYSLDEYQFITPVYEPLLQYDYLARPYQIVPLTASELPTVDYFDKSGQKTILLPKQDIAFSVYTIHIKPGILYQPHPAFAKNVTGREYYYPLSLDDFDALDINTLSDFKHTGTRELTVDDYIYEIKRLANPLNNSPIYGLMSNYIEGFSEFKAQLPKQSGFIDLRNYPLKGLHKVDDYTFQITIKGVYPQFIFWLAMPFFAPIPWEVDRFYAQPGMEDNNLNFGWYPVGTGPFMMAENNPNSRIMLVKNPNFHDEFFPIKGSLSDVQKGYLSHPGARLPFIDKAIYTLEKESIPRWNKFLQGYYDVSGVSSDSFSKAIQIAPTGVAMLSVEMQKKGMRLLSYYEPAIYYLGFNMLDNVVGGKSSRARLLRQAISIAINYDEDIAIFLNGRGSPLQGPIPTGIFGSREGGLGMNPYVYRMNGEEMVRRPLSDAKALMKAAGYPNGIDPTTGNALILHYDVPVTGGPDDESQLNWMKKQLARIGIALDVRATQYSRFQEKLESGNTQLFTWSWSADYPDPENFLFLLYGPNGKVYHGGENNANYSNPTYDHLFDRMKNRSNDEERQQIIDQMINILRYDSPWVWGVQSESFLLMQQWLAPLKPSSMTIDTLKYISIDVPLRQALRIKWNKPILWPIMLLIMVQVLLILPYLLAYQRKERQGALRMNQ